MYLSVQVVLLQFFIPFRFLCKSTLGDIVLTIRILNIREVTGDLFSGQLSIHPTNQRLLRAVWKVYLTIRQWWLIWLVWKWPMLLCWMKALQQLKLWVFVTGKFTDFISHFHERTPVANVWIESVCHQGRNAEWSIMHNDELHDICNLPVTVIVVKSRNFLLEV